MRPGAPRTKIRINRRRVSDGDCLRSFVTGRHRVIWYGIVKRAEERVRGPWHAEAYGVGHGKRRAEQRERGFMPDALRWNTTPRQGTGAAPHPHTPGACTCAHLRAFGFGGDAAVAFFFARTSWRSGLARSRRKGSKIGFGYCWCCCPACARLGWGACMGKGVCAVGSEETCDGEPAGGPCCCP